jgi:hypothetical protein
MMEVVMYTPGEARVGEPTPQSHPDLFSREEILSEVKYLLKLNKRYGSHPLRGQVITRLLAHVGEQGR